MHIVLLKCPHVQIAFLKFASCDNQALVGCIQIPAVAVDLKLKSILVTDYLTKMGIKTVPHPLYHPDLAPCDFCLFPKLTGCRYETIEEMKEAVTKVIDTLTQEDFHGACYIVIYSIMQKYTYICWIHTDAIIIKTPDDKVARTNDARKEDFFIKYFTSHFICKVSKRLFQVCVCEGAGDRTLLKYFDPEVMAVSVVSFSFSMVAQPDPGVNSSVCWLSLLQHVYLRLPLYCLPSFSPISHCPQFVGLILPSNSHAVI